MANIKRKQAEPQFLGIWCTGPDIEKADLMREEIKARSVLEKFYRMSRRDQLVVAAATTELVKRRA